MSEFFSGLPPWLGTAPQWGMFVVLLLGFGKFYLQNRALSTEEDNTQVASYALECGNLREEVRALRQELRECETSCNESKVALQEKIMGLRRNQVQEQISLINVIMRSVNNPELRNLLNLLESVQMSLKTTDVLQTQSGNVIQKPSKETGDGDA